VTAFKACFRHKAHNITDNAERPTIDKTFSLPRRERRQEITDENKEGGEAEVFADHPQDFCQLHTQQN
jgi:hypothetical protein